MPCYLNDSGCAPDADLRRRTGRRRLPLQLRRRRRDADSEAGQHGDGAVRLHHPDHGHRRLAGPPVALRPRASGVGQRGHAGNVEAMASRAQHDVLRHRLVGAGERATSRTTSPRSQDLNKFPDVVDRLQQGVLNTLYLGRLMRTADGFASDPAFQNGSSQPLFSTAHTVLRRQQPGRDHGRHDDRGRARLHPRGAGRSGNGLRRAAAPAEHRLRRSTPPSSSASGRRLHRTTRFIR